jgi:hypothetical protein
MRAREKAHSQSRRQSLVSQRKGSSLVEKRQFASAAMGLAERPLSASVFLFFFA